MKNMETSVEKTESLPNAYANQHTQKSFVTNVTEPPPWISTWRIYDWASSLNPEVLTLFSKVELYTQRPY